MSIKRIIFEYFKENGEKKTNKKGFNFLNDDDEGHSKCNEIINNLNYVLFSKPINIH